eukprot:357715-Chlamydomonas_euryale.AAC.1
MSSRSSVAPPATSAMFVSPPPLPAVRGPASSMSRDGICCRRLTAAAAMYLSLCVSHRQRCRTLCAAPGSRTRLTYFGAELDRHAPGSSPPQPCYSPPCRPLAQALQCFRIRLGRARPCAGPGHYEPRRRPGDA